MRYDMGFALGGVATARCWNNYWDLRYYAVTQPVTPMAIAFHARRLVTD